MIDETEKLKKRFSELADRAQLRQSVTYSDFLNIDEQNTLLSCQLGLPVCLTGGYRSAERRIACFGCENENESGCMPPLKCVEIKPVAPKFADELAHRDFLGTLMGLGIRREMTGDIIICNNIGYIFVLGKIADYITENVDRVRHTSVKCKIVDAPPVESMPKPEEKIMIVASPRLDALVAAVFKLSRASASELFEQGKVFINGRQSSNSSYIAKQDDIISVRGFGRFCFDGSAGETKKSRLKARVRVY